MPINVFHYKNILIKGYQPNIKIEDSGTDTSQNKGCKSDEDTNNTLRDKE